MSGIFLLHQTKMKKIAIQGIKGSFHDIAAHQYFKGEDIELICCDTFEKLAVCSRGNRKHYCGKFAAQLRTSFGEWSYGCGRT